MVAIGSVLLVVAVSLLITRIATVILIATGLSREVARFQARSAFTTAGFTTSESEQVMSHPIRRRIVLTLMLLGNAGVVVAASSLFLGFARGGHGLAAVKLAELLGGIVLLVALSRSRAVDRALTRAIRRLLTRFTDIDNRDYAELLELAGDYAVTELSVCEEDWIAGKTLREAALRDEGIAVLGITRGNDYTGAPTPSARIEPGDTLLLYGRGPELAELDCRPDGAAGDREHEQAVQRQETREASALEV